MHNDGSFYQHKLPHDGLVWYRRLVFVLILTERLWPLILPLLLLGCVFLSCVWFGFFALLPLWLHILILGGFALSILIVSWRLLQFQQPQKMEIDQYIEQKNGLKFQPLIVQSDDLAKDDAISLTLWQAHRQRMRSRLQDLKIGMPFAQIPKHDPHGLRSLIFLSFAIAFSYSFSPTAGRFSDAFAFSPYSVATLPMRIDAWVNPPEYTGLAPIYLNIALMGKEKEPHEDHRILPSGSVVHFRIIDAPGHISLWHQGTTGIRTELEEEGIQSQPNLQLYQLAVKEDMHVQLVTPMGKQAWFFTVIQDMPPQIDWVAQPRRALNGMLEFSYKIEDDYGIEKAWASISTIESQGERQSHPLYDAPQISLVLPRTSKGEASTRYDLSNHPWAGMEAEIVLHAQDGAGNIAKTQPLALTLPQRVFGNPLARAVVEQRRLLVQDGANHGLVADMLAALLIRPEDTIRHASHIIALQSAWTRLSYAKDRQSLYALADYLWQIALGIENDGLDAAEAQLKQAQQALRDALRGGATSQEIERLMRELRQAMREYIAALAERNMRQSLSSADAGKILRSDELEQKLQQLEDLAKLGSRGAAEQLLSELESLLDNLQVMQGQGGTEETYRSERSFMQQNMDNLADQMRRQQEMMNEADRLTQEWRRGESSDEDYAQQMEGLARDQDGLLGEWNSLRERLEQQGQETGQAMEQAGQFMGQARDALERGEGNDATGRQGQALEAMRRAGQEIMQAMRDGVNGQDRQSGSVDPLGRERQSGQALQESDTKIPGEIDMERARRILDEIRARFGHMTPQLERQYLERLLNFMIE